MLILLTEHSQNIPPNSSAVTGICRLTKLSARGKVERSKPITNDHRRSVEDGRPLVPVLASGLLTTLGGLVQLVHAVQFGEPGRRRAGSHHRSTQTQSRADQLVLLQVRVGARPQQLWGGTKEGQTGRQADRPTDRQRHMPSVRHVTDEASKAGNVIHHNPNHS